MYSDIYQNVSSNNNNNKHLEPNMKSSRMSISHAKGLLNMPGQNNCFLNSAVQVLWHLDVFRRSFRELSGHACMADSCIFCALKELFNQFQYSQESALPPDALRFALAEAFSDQRRFQLGFMDDAAECFENILLRIHCHIANQDSEEMCSTTHCLPHCIPHQKFAMNLIEQIICHSCGATSEPFPFTQMVHYVSTPALCAQAKQYDCEVALTFGELLKSAGAVGDIRDCPRSCGARIQIKKSLINKPDIVSIGLVWDSERPTLNHIIDVFRAIGTTLRLPDVFDSVSDCRPAPHTVLQLVGLVTYYGKHYSTFFFHTKLREWIYFDDAAVRAIGPHWQQVVDKCIRGHFQPLLLLYANPNGTPVNTECAPKDIIPLVVKKNTRRPYISGLPAKCDITANNYHSLQTPQRNGMSTHITSDSETNRSIDKKNVSNIMRQISGQNQINKPYSSQQRSEQTYSNINTGLVKPSLNGFVANNNKMRPNNINTLQPKSGFQSGSDVPDSPSGMSSVSYFSDVGELDNRYISRKTVESILNLQRHSLKKSIGNRNSSSSLESFDIRNGALVFHRSLLPTDKPSICSLQRHDSGNSSGDRHSASSASVSSIDSPFYTFANHKRRPLTNFATHRHPPSPKLSSDGGYDSFSLSSSDSYPSVQSSGSPAKMNRLKQIPEDVQLMELINASTLLDCDKLCSAADVLLLKSHEKEREGDLRAAAALSDSAASKARSAMDAPYSNHQTLITAKMKHSMCVMRSASLHKRLNEMEAEEKRRIKEQLSASTGAVNHSRQGSRDSTHSKHSRQGSKDSKDPKNKEVVTTKHSSLDFNKIRAIDSSVTIGNTIELYATLPKKGSKKKLLQQSLNTLASLRIKSDDSNLYKDVISKRDSINSITTELSLQSTLKKKTENNKKCENNKLMTNNIKTKNNVNPMKIKATNCEIISKQSSRESDFSDYYSEWEATRRSQQSLQRTLSGSASCKENDSEFYGEVGSFTAQSTGKKQHKVRRKLLMGGFMKRKNRSLPDLREGAKNGSNEAQNGPQDILNELSEKETPNECKSIAQISAKGFHQTHRAFISERGLYQRPSLLKVSPPLIEKTEQTYESVSNTYNTSKVISNPKTPTNHINNQFLARSPSPPPPTPPKGKTSTPIVESNPSDKKCVENSFLKELASKRAEIMKNSLKDNCIENKSNIQTPKELINHMNPQNCGSNIKPVLKNSLMKNSLNVENDNYESINLKARAPPHSHPSHSLINQMPNSINKSISSQTTQMISPKIVEQTDDSNPTNRSVRDLTSKFEKIMNKNENSNEKLNENTIDLNESKRIEKTDSLSLGTHRMVALMANNKLNEESNACKPMTQPVCDTNKADNYSVQSPTTIQSPIPVNNCLTPAVRPNRPPDYQTALKRIGMLRNDKNGINIQQNRPFYMNASGNIIQSRSPQSLQIQSQLNEQQKSVTQKPINSSEVPKQQLLFNNKIHTNCEDTQQNSLTRKKNTFKKSVSFSDQVVLVACAEEDQEEHLPNPILERVLAKNNMSFAPQSP